MNVNERGVAGRRCLMREWENLINVNAGRHGRCYYTVCGDRSYATPRVLGVVFSLTLTEAKR